MRRRPVTKLQFYIVTLVFAFGFAAVSPAFHFASKSGAAMQLQNRTLTLDDRVAYQRAVEEVYWRHRIWPKERADSKPPLDAVLSQAQIETNVEDYLRNSVALENDWHHAITAEQLQAEMDRMAQHSKDPAMLRELFQAAGDDPFVIAECLARPALSQRLLTSFGANRGESRVRSELREQINSRIPSVEAESNEQGRPGSGSFRYTLPAITAVASVCTNDTWTPTGNVPANRAAHTAVWTGSEMIVWGGVNYDKAVSNGEKYDPATDAWTVLSSINAPSPRSGHSAVWTGNEMIIWGGGTNTGYVNTGARYNPSADSWTAISPTNVVIAPRGGHTAVWTGSEMIVWGGSNATGNLNTGAKYNPGTGRWKAITTTNAPVGRIFHTAVWSGSVMIVWGGLASTGSYTNTGGRYDPAADKWTPTGISTAPGIRSGHSAIWAGNEMIVWGGWIGSASNQGARYNPTTDIWIPTSVINAPGGRFEHTAVWTGSEMIIWGGNGATGDPGAGGKYNPSTDSWTAISTINSPGPRTRHSALWTGSEMIIFGGGYGETLNTGERYDPAADSWTNIHTSSAPIGRYQHSAIWTGSEMIVWGGEASYTFATNTGGRYDPALDSWTPTSLTNAPASREGHTAVWTGTEMIVWGGWYSDGESIHILNTGGKYNPTSDSWAATSLQNAPESRRSHTAVWTGSEMIVWGGEDGSVLNTGGRYDPDTDTWTATSTTNAPDPRLSHTAIWTGDTMIVWGGGAYTASNTGGRYNPLDDAWEPTSTGTQSRTGHTAIWTGDEMVVWGGYSGGFNGSHLNTGARYNPSTDSWMPTSVLSAPEERGAHAAVWTGAEMIIWGGYDGQASRFLNSGGRYNPQSDVWTLTNVANAPSPVEFPAAVWTGSQMIVWGGYDGNFVLNTGSRYCADAAATPAPVPTATPIVSVSVSPPQVMEGGVATFQIGASPNTTRPVTVAFTMSGKAKNGTDYILSNSGQVTIPFGFDSIPVFLITIADHAKEMKETATMTLQPGSGYSFGGAGGKKKKVKPPKATVTLIDTP